MLKTMSVFISAFTINIDFNILKILKIIMY